MFNTLPKSSWNISDICEKKPIKIKMHEKKNPANFEFNEPRYMKISEFTLL